MNYEIKLREYLDNAISQWRKVLNESKVPEEITIATCYIDAFQSVRISVLGELLP